MAAYQANYGFNQEGDPDENKAALSSSDPAPPGPNKVPEKKKPVDPDPEQQETSAQEAKQKGEKRKPEPGKLTTQAEQ